MTFKLSHIPCACYPHQLRNTFERLLLSLGPKSLNPKLQSLKNILGIVFRMCMVCDMLGQTQELNPYSFQVKSTYYTLQCGGTDSLNLLRYFNFVSVTPSPSMQLVLTVWLLSVTHLVSCFRHLPLPLWLQAPPWLFSTLPRCMPSLVYLVGVLC